MKIDSTVLQRFFLSALLLAFLAGCASNGQQDTSGEGDFDDTSGAVASGIDDASTLDAVDDGADDVALETVFYFDYDASTLTSGARAALDAQAAALRGGSSDIRLEGHADERGSREYNLALGERRAKAVADYLAIQGVSRSRIEVISYGEERPVSLRSDEAGYAQNRRVELK